MVKIVYTISLKETYKRCSETQRSQQENAINCIKNHVEVSVCQSFPQTYDDRSNLAYPDLFWRGHHIKANFITVSKKSNFWWYKAVFIGFCFCGFTNCCHVSADSWFLQMADLANLAECTKKHFVISFFAALGRCSQFWEAVPLLRIWSYLIVAFQNTYRKVVVDWDLLQYLLVKIELGCSLIFTIEHAHWERLI